jgi:hypothetical protein
MICCNICIIEEKATAAGQVFRRRRVSMKKGSLADNTAKEPFQTALTCISQLTASGQT